MEVAADSNITLCPYVSLILWFIDRSHIRFYELFEAVVNMLMHTDYHSTSAPHIRIFNHHIEFYNPGGLPKPLKELKEKDLSIPRNPILAKLFRMVKLAENVGYGFDKIEKNWKIYNNTQPEYEIDFDSVIVKMDIDKLVGVHERNIDEGLNEGLNEGLKSLLITIKENEGIQAKDLSVLLGNRPIKTIERQIATLIERELIERIGSRKTGGYFIKKD